MHAASLPPAQPADVESALSGRRNLPSASDEDDLGFREKLHVQVGVLLDVTRMCIAPREEQDGLRRSACRSFDRPRRK